MIRTSMTTLVSYLRSFTDSQATDEFSDDDLQDYLDLNKSEYRLVMLIGTPERIYGSVIYRKYYLPEFLGVFFETPQDDTINDFFYLQDDQFVPILFGVGDDKAVFDPYLRRIIFNTDVKGKYYYLTVLVYDVFGAAADVWEAKIANRTTLITIKTDNQTLSMKDEYDHCVDRMKYYRGLSNRNQATTMVREDQVDINDIGLIIKGFAPLDYLESLR